MSSFGAARRLPAALALLIVLLLVVGLQPGFAQSRNSQARERERSVDALLESFPIGTQRVSTKARATAKASTPAAARGSTRASTPAATREAVRVEAAGPTSDEPPWLLYAGAATLLLLAASAFVVFRLRDSDEAPAFAIDTTHARLNASTLALFNQALALANERSPGVTEIGKNSNAAAPAPGADAAHDRDYVDVGKSVTGILEAAEAAAAQIRAEASDVATEIRKAAEAEAQVYLEKAKQQAAKIESDAEAAALETRSGAESFVALRRREAEAQAEENLRRALHAFRGISDELEEILQAEAEAAAEVEESLVEALQGSARESTQ